MLTPVTSWLPVTPLTVGDQLLSASAGVAVSVQSVGLVPLPCFSSSFTSVSFAGSGTLVAVQTTSTPGASVIVPSAPSKTSRPDRLKPSCCSQSHDPVEPSTGVLPSCTVCL